MQLIEDLEEFFFWRCKPPRPHLLTIRMDNPDDYLGYNSSCSTLEMIFAQLGAVLSGRIEDNKIGLLSVFCSIHKLLKLERGEVISDRKERRGIQIFSFELTDGAQNAVNKERSIRMRF